ncbi:Flagellar basal-body rod protein FlgC [Rosistilla carotiformis]|uniref:Flagellar basal-body rod protein FlgC n=1 Tax=Rosistilla carotiformis TaxID=2528017 RepID=A0A518JND0_9BACT|nr:flagellar basal body rod protein FlgC [Rosistilla carotiformis]QDV67043.1 Flagellar basal-body rod protein FlgC [Rosistilla carotiformis]
MISALDISTSALVAQRVRLNTISGNIANMSSLKDETGKAAPYKGRSVVFQTDNSVSTNPGVSGVKVDSIEISDAEPIYRYQPQHPLAIKEGKYQGYVAYPNIDMTTQMVDALEATRSYEANIGVMEITKNLGRESLSIIA